MCRRVVFIILAAAAAALGLTGCDPYSSSGVADGVGISVILNAEGGAQTQLFLDSHVRSHAELIRLGKQVAPRLFPTASGHTVVVDDNSGGYPFVNISTSGVYEPGPQPQFSLDGRPAASFLLGNGFRSVDLYIQAPVVPVIAEWVPSGSEDSGTWRWNGLVAGAAAPTGSIEMAPEPWRGVLPLALTAGAVGLAVFSGFALRRGRRVLAAATALGSCAIVLGVVMDAGAVQADNLGVAGYLSGAWLTAAAVVPLLGLPVAFVAFTFLVAALVIRPVRPRLVFSSPPGWPVPPPGWIPPPGWTPDPTWPPAPADWNFYVDPSATDEAAAASR
jgi:hypothetical protein